MPATVLKFRRPKRSSSTRPPMPSPFGAPAAAAPRPSANLVAISQLSLKIGRLEKLDQPVCRVLEHLVDDALERCAAGGRR